MKVRVSISTIVDVSEEKRNELKRLSQQDTDSAIDHTAYEEITDILMRGSCNPVLFSVDDVASDSGGGHPAHGSSSV